MWCNYDDCYDDNYTHNTTTTTITITTTTANPSIFTGFSICCFRKSNTEMPTCLHGIVIDSPFGMDSMHDNMMSPLPSNHPDGEYHDGNYTPFTPQNMKTKDNSKLRVKFHDNVHKVCEVSSPFWIKDCNAHDSTWCDPDEYFDQQNVKHSYVTSYERKIFWECIFAIVELPQLQRSISMNSRLRSVDDLTKILERPEYSILWQDNNVNCLPKAVTCALLTSMYSDEAEKRNKKNHLMFN